MVVGVQICVPTRGTILVVTTQTFPSEVKGLVEAEVTVAGARATTVRLTLLLGAGAWYEVMVSAGSVVVLKRIRQLRFLSCPTIVDHLWG